MRSGAFSARAFIGLLLVVLGIMFLLDTTNALGPGGSVFGTYWPVFLIAWGAWHMLTGGGNRIAPLIILATGVSFLLSNLGVLPWSFWALWPLAIILIGVFMLLSARRRRIPASAPPGREWRQAYVFGGGKDKLSAQPFQGGQITAIFGGGDLDLRDATLPHGKAVIDATVICGGVNLIVRRDWTVNVRASAIFGGVKNKHQQPPAEQSKGELTITGTALFGGIEVKD